MSGDYSDLFNAVQLRHFAELSMLASFKNVEKHVQSNKGEWSTLVKAIDAESKLPACWEKPKDNVTEAIQSEFRRLLLLKAFRPDRLIFGATKFVASVFGNEFVQLPGT